MTILGAAGDTWGIPGPNFALLYLLAAIVVVTGVALWRRAATAGPVRRARQLNPSEVAYLAGGASGAAAGALATLQSTGSVGIGPGGRLEAIGPMPRVTSELDRAVYSAAGRRVARRGLADDPAVSSTLERVRAALVQKGWLLDEAARRRVRLASLPVFALVLVGLARLVASILDSEPVGFLLVQLGAVVVAQLLLLAAPQASRAAAKVLNGQRSHPTGPMPRRPSSWARYGMTEASADVGLIDMGVGMTGVSPDAGWSGSGGDDGGGDGGGDS